MSPSDHSRSAAVGSAALSVILSLALPGCPASSVPALDAGPAPIDAPAIDAPAIDAPNLDAPDLDAPGDLDAPSDLDAPPGLDARTSADAPILAPFDTGDPFGDAGTLGTPEWVPIEVLTMGSCPPLVACGGDEVGTWDVTGACVEIPIPAALFSCPGATAIGSGMARGRVTFTGTVAIRAAQSVVNVEVFVPTLCAGLIGGCTGLETMLQGAVPDSACVTETAGCRCAARQAFELDDGDAYTIVGNEIVSATLGRRWAYCVTGANLSYQDTTPPGGSTPMEPGTIELGRR